jgi:hypothetical protein
LTQSDSIPTGDKCHYLIVSPQKSFYRNTVKNTPLGAYEICDNGAPRALTLSDILKQNPVPA